MYITKSATEEVKIVYSRTTVSWLSKLRYTTSRKLRVESMYNIRYLKYPSTGTKF